VPDRQSPAFISCAMRVRTIHTRFHTRQEGFPAIRYGLCTDACVRAPAHLAIASSSYKRRAPGSPLRSYETGSMYLEVESIIKDLTIRELETVAAREAKTQCHSGTGRARLPRYAVRAACLMMRPKWGVPLNCRYTPVRLKQTAPC
jgi:hypothetical protein